MLDIKIIGGTVIDGTGAASARADVGVLDGRIVAVGDVPDGARRVIDATDMVVAPGFIDLHTHYDAELEVAPALTESLRHGVTTALIGSCVLSLVVGEPDYMADLQRDLIAVISKYIKINPNDIKVQLERQDNLEVLEVKIELPDAR